MNHASEEAQIRAAERALEQALESVDPTAWVDCYTEDAVFAAPGAPTVEGRSALLEMAGALKPMSSVSIRALRTQLSGDLASTYGNASWARGRPPDAVRTVSVRFAIVWRREADGQWRVAQEFLNFEDGG